MYFNFPKVLTLILFFFFAINLSQAQTPGKPGGNAANFFNTSAFGGQLGHLQAGSFGSFATNSRWIGIGQPSGVSAEFYGMRIQDRGTLATFTLNGGDVKDLEIQWGSNTNSRLKFNFANSLTTQTRVMELTPSGRLTAFNRIRAANSGTNASEYTEIGHGGSNGYINTVGDGRLDFRLDGVTRMQLSSNGLLEASNIIRSNTSASSSIPEYTEIGHGGGNGYINTVGDGNLDFRHDGVTRMLLAPSGQLEAFNIIRSNTSTSSTIPEYTEIGHGGGNGYINTVGDGDLDFRHDGANKMRLTTDGHLALNRSTADFTLDVNGNTRNTTGVWSTSDRRFKKGIQALSATTEKLLQLEGVSYQFKQEKVGDLDLSYVDDKTHIGFIAQDLVQLFPELVMQDEEGFYAVRYEGLIPVMVEGMKDQQEVIEEQKTTIYTLTDKVQKLESQMATILQALEIKSGQALDGNGEDKAMLRQNRPNPFEGRTTIDFQLPKNVDAAELIVYDINGRQVSQSLVNDQKGSIDIDASQLTKGTYIYALVVDGEVLTQKTMVIQ